MLEMPDNRLRCTEDGVLNWNRQQSPPPRRHHDKSLDCASRLSSALALSVCNLTASFAQDLSAAPHWPGLQADGRTLLPNQWTIEPAGKQIQLGDFPVNIAVHPTEPWAAVLHCGYGEHEVVIVDLKRKEDRSRFKFPQSFYGLTFDPDGKRLFASGAEFEVVHQFAFADGQLSDHNELRIAGTQIEAGPDRLACSRDGKTLFVASAWGGPRSIVPLDEPDEARESSTRQDGSYPYAILPTRDGQRLYVSLWGHGGVAVIDLADRKVADVWPVGSAGVGGASSHPTEMVLSPDEKLLYVACSNGNSVVVSIRRTGRHARTDLERLCIHKPRTAARRAASPSRPTAKCCWSPTPTTTTWR